MNAPDNKREIVLWSLLTTVAALLVFLSNYILGQILPGDAPRCFIYHLLVFSFAALPVILHRAVILWVPQLQSLDEGNLLNRFVKLISTTGALALGWMISRSLEPSFRDILAIPRWAGHIWSSEPWHGGVEYYLLVLFLGLGCLRMISERRRLYYAVCCGIIFIVSLGSFMKGVLKDQIDARWFLTLTQSRTSHHPSGGSGIVTVSIPQSSLYLQRSTAFRLFTAFVRSKPKVLAFTGSMGRLLPSDIASIVSENRCDAKLVFGADMWIPPPIEKQSYLGLLSVVKDPLRGNQDFPAYYRPEGGTDFGAIIARLHSEGTSARSVMIPTTWDWRTYINYYTIGNYKPVFRFPASVQMYWYYTNFNISDYSDSTDVLTDGGEYCIIDRMSSKITVVKGGWTVSGFHVVDSAPSDHFPSLEGKTVIVDDQSTRFGHGRYTTSTIYANIIENILDRDFITVPSPALDTLVCLTLTLLAGFSYFRFKRLGGLVLSMSALAVMALLSLHLFLRFQFFIEPTIILLPLILAMVFFLPYEGFWERRILVLEIERLKTGFPVES